MRGMGGMWTLRWAQQSPNWLRPPVNHVGEGDVVCQRGWVDAAVTAFRGDAAELSALPAARFKVCRAVECPRFRVMRNFRPGQGRRRYALADKCTRRRLVFKGGVGR